MWVFGIIVLMEHPCFSHLVGLTNFKVIHLLYCRISFLCCTTFTSHETDTSHYYHHRAWQDCLLWPWNCSLYNFQPRQRILVFGSRVSLLVNILPSLCWGETNFTVDSSGCQVGPGRYISNQFHFHRRWLLGWKSWQFDTTWLFHQDNDSRHTSKRVR